MKTITGTCSSAIVYTDIIEETAEEQIKLLCDQPFVKGSRIRIMPDVHTGSRNLGTQVAEHYQPYEGASLESGIPCPFLLFTSVLRDSHYITVSAKNQNIFREILHHNCR